MADFGTRLKATFNNIPAGARIFVSTANVNNNAFPIAVPAVVGGSAANANPASPTGGYVGYAQLINGENTNDGNAGVSGLLPGGNRYRQRSQQRQRPIAEVSLVNGSGTAVWEVVNTNPNTIESFKFAVYTTYSANVAAELAAAGYLHRQPELRPDGNLRRRFQHAAHSAIRG